MHPRTSLLRGAPPHDNREEIWSKEREALRESLGRAANAEEASRVERLKAQHRRAAYQAAMDAYAVERNGFYERLQRGEIERTDPIYPPAFTKQPPGSPDM